MPLAINDTQTLSGGTGRRGRDGADAVLIGAGNGVGGSNGRSGGAATIDRGATTLNGDAGNDSVVMTLTATGGAGGGGGRGGAGLHATSTASSQFGATFQNSFLNYGGNSDGGAGGRGGGGGAGSVVVGALVLDLLATPGGTDLVVIDARATGGPGGMGGIGGAGGLGGTGTVSDMRQYGVPGSFYTITYDVTSARGGEAGNAGTSIAGARGLVAFDQMTVRGETLTLRLEGTAMGGGGVGGQSPLNHATGGSVANALHGGDGAAGGAALARVTELRVTATGALDLDITLASFGSFGGGGGVGASAVGANFSTTITTNDIGTVNNTAVYSLAGNGGGGGMGGAATTIFTLSTILGSALADQVSIDLRARGGEGGRGGPGGLGAASSIVVTGTAAELLTTTSVQGTPDGSPGVSGAGGAGRITMTGNTIALGDSDDSLEILLAITSSGPATFTAQRNVLDGGAGTDTLTFGDRFTAGQPDLLFNVANGTWRINGGAGGNTMTGFERFVGGAGNDRFIDATGDQTYSGRGGEDRFEFFATRPGNDAVLVFDVAEDVIALRGFGPARDEFAEVLAAATQVAGGVLIQTGAASSVLLTGVRIADLQANDFLF